MKETDSTKAPTDSISAIIELYKLTVEQCLRNLQKLQRFAEELREAGRKLRKTS